MQVTRNGGYEARESTDSKYLYYAKREPSIWRMPVEGGAETLVIDQVRYGYWALLEKGICFVSMGGVPQPAIEFFNFATRQVTQLTKLEKGKSPFGAPNLAVSADGLWVLY